MERYLVAKPPAAHQCTCATVASSAARHWGDSERRVARSAQRVDAWHATRLVPRLRQRSGELIAREVDIASHGGQLPPVPPEPPSQLVVR